MLRKSVQHFVCSLVAASALAAMGSTLARADDAVVSFTTFLRDGPGERYRVIDEIAEGLRVERDACDGGWCRIVSGRASGYVPQAFLTQPKDARMPASPTCFVDRIAGYKNGSDQRFCVGQ